MKIVGNIIAGIIMVLAIQGCKTDNTKHEAITEQVSAAKELVIKGQVSVPLPEAYEKVILEENSMVITAEKYTVVYRWIEQQEIEFIGSNKSPYDFFESVFNNPTSDEEKRFLEGLQYEAKRANSLNSLNFYYFNNGRGRQIYILSEALSFVVEVTYRGEAYHHYIDSVIMHSKLSYSE